MNYDNKAVIWLDGHFSPTKEESDEVARMLGNAPEIEVCAAYKERPLVFFVEFYFGTGNPGISIVTAFNKGEARAKVVDLVADEPSLLVEGEEFQIVRTQEVDFVSMDAVLVFDGEY